MNAAQVSLIILGAMTGLGLGYCSYVEDRYGDKLTPATKSVMMLLSPLLGIVSLFLIVLNVWKRIELWRLKRQLRRMLDQADDLERVHSEMIRREQTHESDGQIRSG